MSKKQVLKESLRLNSVKTKIYSNNCKDFLIPLRYRQTIRQIFKAKSCPIRKVLLFKPASYNLNCLLKNISY